MNIKKKLKKKYGPLPFWVWVIITTSIIIMASYATYQSQSLADDIAYCLANPRARYCACGISADYGSNPKSLLDGRSREFNEEWHNNTHIKKCWFTEVRIKEYCPGGVENSDPLSCKPYTPPEEEPDSDTQTESAQVKLETILLVFGTISVIFILGYFVSRKTFKIKKR